MVYEPSRFQFFERIKDKFLFCFDIVGIFVDIESGIVNGTGEWFNLS
ncbi:MAG: hypothetical protein PHX34_01970 [Candidatus Shapirobacteria bacterium]|nr:hypothetical protein [Candidatus Shapirobacteria bacterium]